MKCLVFSDSHGSPSLMRRAILQHKDAEVIFFLGDGLSDADYLAREFSDRAWIAVRGNCDFSAVFRDGRAEKTEEITLAGHKIVATHGDLYNVKYSEDALVALAKKTEADIVLFGHTHKPYEKYLSDNEPPIWLFNPGSIAYNGASYGIITLGKVPLFSHGHFL